MKFKEKYLCDALDKFKEMILNDDCSKEDINYFCNLSKYELDRRGYSIDKIKWLTKKEASALLNISTSTFDRIVFQGKLPKGRKIMHKKSLVWKYEEIEQLK